MRPIRPENPSPLGPALPVARSRPSRCRMVHRGPRCGGPAAHREPERCPAVSSSTFRDTVARSLSLKRNVVPPRALVCVLGRLATLKAGGSARRCVITGGFAGGGVGVGAGVGVGVDVVVNYTGGDTWTKSLRVLRVGGRLLTCGATAGYDPPEDIRFIWTFELKILGSNGWPREDIVALFAEIDRAFGGAGVQLFPDGDELAAIEHQPPITRRILRPKAEHDQCGAIGQCGPHPPERCRPS